MVTSVFDGDNGTKMKLVGVNLNYKSLSLDLNMKKSLKTIGNI